MGYHPKSASASTRPCVSAPSLLTAVARQARRLLARAAADVPLATGRARMEPLDARRLLALTWDFTLVDQDNEFREMHDEVMAMMAASTAQWSAIFDTDVSLQVEVRIEDQGPFGFLASAGPVVYQHVRSSGTDDVIEPGPGYEIRTGFDPNGREIDAIVTWNAFFLENDEIFTETGPSRTVPAEQYDGVTIATHELGHVLGFIGLRHPVSGATFERNTTTGRYELTPYDQLVQPLSGELFFTGTNARKVYGGRVGLHQGNFGSGVSHYGGPASPDLEDDLMSFSIEPGVKQEISLLDQAFLSDLGMPVVAEFGTPLPTGGSILTINGTPFDDDIEVTFTGSTYVVTINGVTTYDDTFDDFQRVSVSGGDGDDHIFVNGDIRSVTLNGGDGDDSLVGGNGNDTLIGGHGDDTLEGGAGHDFLQGEGGQDRLIGGSGQNQLFGGSSGDYLQGGSAADSIFGGDGNDRIFGGGGQDTIFGDDGNDTMDGGAGNDSFDGGLGADIFIGGGGTRDRADFEERNGALSITADGIANDGEAGEGDNLLSGIEVVVAGRSHDLLVGNRTLTRFFGGNGRDTIIGGTNPDFMDGGSNGDVLIGNDGDDTLSGGVGNDHVHGGNGVDRLRGNQGDDLIFAADRFDDFIWGGNGNDFAEIDQRDYLVDEDVEDVEELTIA